MGLLEENKRFEQKSQNLQAVDRDIVPNVPIDNITHIVMKNKSETFPPLQINPNILAFVTQVTKEM